jgi:hypothetical protein
MGIGDNMGSSFTMTGGTSVTDVLAGAWKDELVYTINGGGTVIPAGETAWIPIAYTGFITGWDLSADLSGSVTMDVWHCTAANYPPVIGNTITASAKPYITSALRNSSTTLTGWTVNFAAGDYFKFYVESISTITKLVVTLFTQRT